MSFKAASIYVKMSDALDPPAAPLVSGATDTTIPLEWEGDFAATGYILQRSNNGSTGWVTVYTGAITSFVDTERLPATAYYYRLAATAPGVTSGYSSTVTGTTTSTVGPPSTPAAPTSSATDTDSTVLSWTAVSGGSFTLQRSLSSSTGWATVYSGADTTYTDSGLSAGTVYYYRLSVSTTGGTSAYSSNRQVTTSSAGSNVTPVSALRITRRSGVCTHPNFNTNDSVYKSANADAFCSRIAGIGMKFIRGSMPPAAIADDWAAACRTYGLKWLMTVVPEAGTRPTSQSIAETTSEVRRIRDNYADICAGIEGLNEPNHNRGGGTVPLDWATNASYGAISHQIAIWNAARDPLAGGGANPLAAVPIVGPSLHDVAAQNSYTQTTASGGLRHYHQLAYGTGTASAPAGLLDASGNLRYCTMLGLHTYPGGSYPLRNLDLRLGYLHSAFPGASVWCTEHGWHNALNTTAGHNPISEAGAGVYGPRGILQYVSNVKNVGGAPDVSRDLYYTYYEGLDDSQSLTLHEERFGLYGVGAGVSGSGSATDPTKPTTWREKPVATSIGAMLNALANPANTATYTPTSVTLSVTCSTTGHELQYQVTATKAQSDAGTASLWIWRNKDIWNTATKTAITVNKVDITVTDRVGTRSFTGTNGINAEVTRIDLR